MTKSLHVHHRKSVKGTGMPQSLNGRRILINMQFIGLQAGVK